MCAFHLAYKKFDRVLAVSVPAEVEDLPAFDDLSVCRFAALGPFFQRKVATAPNRHA
jgi:hypothetical protein